MMVGNFPQKKNHYRNIVHNSYEKSIMESIVKRLKITPDSSEKKKNLQKIDEFLRLEYDWNLNGASPFQQSLIDTAKFIVNNILFQPQIFPTARNSIQFEYEKKTGEYLEFEIYEDKVHLLQVYDNDEEFEDTFDVKDMNKINRAVEKFYGR